MSRRGPVPGALRGLSSNVDLFKKIWEHDPTARFYGGTSRDFLWFVRGEPARATSREDLAARIARLKSRPIFATDFIVGLSDIDVITRNSLDSVDYDKTFLTRIESIAPEWLEPGNERYDQEMTQGYVAAEKIQLGKKGLTSLLGDGVKEIYEGRPTLHLDPRITETPFYKAGENHPILLVLRYLRQVAIAYYRLHGRGYPDEKALFRIVDKEPYSTQTPGTQPLRPEFAEIALRLGLWDHEIWLALVSIPHVAGFPVEYPNEKDRRAKQIYDCLQATASLRPGTPGP